MRPITSRLAVLCNSVPQGEQRVLKGLLDHGRKIEGIEDITDDLVLIDAYLILIALIKNEIKLRLTEADKLLQIIYQAKDTISDIHSKISVQAEMQTQKSPENLASYLSVSAHCFTVANDLGELSIHLVSEVREFLYKLSFNLVRDNKDGKNLQLHAQVKQIACCIALINYVPQSSEHSLRHAHNEDKLLLKPPALSTSPVVASSPATVIQPVDQAASNVGVLDEKLNHVSGLLHIIEIMTTDLLESVASSTVKTTVKPGESSVQINAQSGAALTTENPTVKRSDSSVHLNARSRAASTTEMPTVKRNNSSVQINAQSGAGSTPENPTLKRSDSSIHLNARSRAGSTSENPTLKKSDSSVHLNALPRAESTTELATVKTGESDAQISARLRAVSTLERQVAISSEPHGEVTAKTRATLITEKLNDLTGYVITDLQLSTDLFCVANELLNCKVLSGVELLLRLSFIFSPPPKQNIPCKHECKIYLSMVSYLCAEIKSCSESKQFNNGTAHAEQVNELYSRLRLVINYIEENLVRLPPDIQLARACLQTARTLELTSVKLKAEKCKFNMFVIHFIGDEQMTMQEKVSFYRSALPDALSDMRSKTAQLLSLPLKANRIIQELNLQISQLRLPGDLFERCKSSLSSLLREGHYVLVENLCLFGIKVTPTKDVNTLLLLQVIRFKSLLPQKQLSKKIVAEKVLIEIAQLFNNKNFIHLLHMLKDESKERRKKHALSELDDRAEDEADIRLIMYLAMFKKLYGPEFNEKYLAYYNKLCFFMIEIMVEKADHIQLFNECYSMLYKASNEADAESKHGFLQCCYALFSMLKMVYVDGDATVRAIVEIQTFLSIEEHKAEFLWWRNRLEEKISAMVSHSNVLAENRYLRGRVKDMERQVTGLKEVLISSQTQLPQLPVLFKNLSACRKSNSVSNERRHSVARDEMLGGNTRDGMLGRNNNEDAKQPTVMPGGRMRSLSQP